MGRALARRPKLFLFDEPLSNLDARLRINVRLELMKLHQQIKGTILYVTHDQVEAMTLGDIVVVMKEGKVRQIDRPEIIYNHPADTFVATFIGTPTMNLFKGKLIRIDGHLTFKSADFLLDPGDVPSRFEGTALEVGIRPEDIKIVHESKNAFEATVDMISNVGAEKYIHAKLGSTSLTARAAKENSFNLGESIFLFIQPSKLHIFHKGRRV
jgi:ABC-type sugar transport system ATPase subunit